MLELIRKTEDEKACLGFMESHLENSDFRKELIEKALAGKSTRRRKSWQLKVSGKTRRNFPAWQMTGVTIY